MEDYCTLDLNNNLSRGFFHEMTRSCNSSLSFLPAATFFIQLIRLSVAMMVLLLLLTLYNIINVMDRHILSTATCSLYWILMVITMGIKSISLMVFVPIQLVGPQGSSVKNVLHNMTSNDAGVETSGFLVLAFLQSAISLLLFLALDHERQFRSADYATVDTPSKHCIALSCSCKLLCSWPRLVALVLTSIPIAILIAIEILFVTTKSASNALTGKEVILVWAYIITLPLTRLAAVAVGVVIMIQRSTKLAPTIMARVYLVLGLLLSIMEDFPNFVTSCNHHRGCMLKVMTVFDMLQLLGIPALVFFLLFIRSQYLRIEQESKLNLVWDLQKLLQVNGRKDIVRHKHYT